MRTLDLKLVLTGDAKGLTATVDATQAELEELARAADKAGGSIDEATDSFSAAESKLRSMIPVITAAGAAWATWEAIQIADKFNILDQRIKTATASTGDYLLVSQRLFDISSRTGSALESNVEVFQNLARASKDLGAANEDILKLTETINQLGIIGGSTQDQMTNAMRQFSQALGGGIVRAEEFNSVLENTPEIAVRIADGLGMTVTELRNAVNEGQILSEQVLASLLQQAPQISQEFESMPRTLSQATQNLTNSMERFLAMLDDGIGLSSKMAGIFDAIANQLNRLSDPLIRYNTELRTALNTITAIEKREAEYERAGGLINKWLIGDKDKAISDLNELRTEIEQTGVVLQKALEPSEDLDTVIDQMEQYESGFSELAKEVESTDSTIKTFSTSVDRSTTSIRRARSETTSLVREMERIRDEVNGVTGEQRKYLDAIETTNEALAKNLVSEQEHAEILEYLNGKLDEATSKTIEHGKQGEKTATDLANGADFIASAFDRAFKSIDRGFVDLWRSAFRGFEDFAKTFKNAILNMAAEIAHALITRPIVMTIVGQFVPMGGAGMAGAMGIGGTGAFGASPGAGLLGSLTGTSIGTGLGNLGFNVATGLGMGPDAAANLFGPTTMVPNWAFGVGALGGGLLGGMMFSGKYAGIGSNVGSSLGSAIGSVFGPVGTIVGGLLGGVLGGLTGSLFGDKTDPRMQLITQGGGTRGFEDNVYEESALGTIGFGGKSHKINAEEFRPIFQAIEDVDNLIAEYIGEAAVKRIDDYLDRETTKMKGLGWASETFYDLSDENLGQAIADRWADLLAEGGNEFSMVLSRFAENLDGTTEEVITAMAEYAGAVKTIETSMEEQLGIFGERGFSPESLTSAIDFVEGLAKPGETLIETFTRLSESLHIVTQVIETFGLQMDLVGQELIEMSQAVVDAFPGGAEEFKQKTAFYYERFFTPEERAERSLKQARSEIERLNEDLGIEGNLIDTTQELRDFVESLDLTTEAGRDAFVAAMDLAQAIIAQDEATKLLYQDIERLNAQIAQIPELIAAIDESIDDVRRNIEMTGLEGEERYNYIKAEIDKKMQELTTAGSTEEFATIINEINSLIMEAWTSLTAEQQEILKQDFLSMLDEYQAYAEQQAEALEKRLERERDILEMHRNAAAQMTEASGRQMQAAQSMSVATGAFSAAVASMPRSFTVNVIGGEIGGSNGY